MERAAGAREMAPDRMDEVSVPGSATDDEAQAPAMAEAQPFIPPAPLPPHLERLARLIVVGRASAPRAAAPGFCRFCRRSCRQRNRQPKGGKSWTRRRPRSGG